MARVPPVSLEDSTERNLWEFADTNWGFVPNSFRTLVRKPELAEVCRELADVIMARPGRTSIQLRWLVAHVTSRAAGCKYCSAHSGHFSEEKGVVERAKLDAVWNFESDDNFDEAERAALRVGLHAGFTPNAVTDEMMAELRKHYDDEAVVEIVSVISLFGFFNRWNDTMMTDLEAGPLVYAQRHMNGTDWVLTRDSALAG